jgi:hypothetical protein
VRRRLWIVPLLLTLGCAPPRAAHAPPVAPERFHLFLLAGQSNMAGRGVVEEQDRVPHSRVWMLGREGQWIPAVEPVHYDKPIAGVGPGRSFAIALAEADLGIHVGLIPAAVGGSSIVAWEPGAVHGQTGSRPYDDAIARARTAMRQGRLKGILWHQGASDATASLAPAYEARLEALVRRFRGDLGSPDLPVLIGLLGRFAERPWDRWRMRVDDAHRSLAGRLPHAAAVSVEGLGHKGDTVHFSAPAARELGRRYADVYLRRFAAVGQTEYGRTCRSAARMAGEQAPEETQCPR